MKFERVRTIPAAGMAILIAILGGVRGAEAQEALGPVATVETFLRAMAQRDATSALGVVIAEGRFTSVREEAGKRVIRSFSNQEDIASWGARSETVLERIWNPEVSQHGHMAIVTAPYDFYRNSTFSHCGVDVFELLETESGWRISGGAYTVEKLECPRSPLGPPIFDAESGANERSARVDSLVEFPMLDTGGSSPDHSLQPTRQVRLGWLGPVSPVGRAAELRIR